MTVVAAKSQFRSYPAAVSVVRRVGPTSLTPHAFDTFAAIQTWLLEDASAEREMIHLVFKFIRRMKAAGSSIDRFTLHIGTLHPQLLGFAWVWYADDGFCDEVRVTDAASISDAYRLNPLQRILETGETIRRSPEAAAAQAEFPIMAELAAAGMTDYVAIPLSGLDSRNVITIATKAAGGFSATEVDSLIGLFKVFALHVQRHSELKISENALGAYLGTGAAAKVLKGAIKRGSGDSIRAVIWVSDLRNFTKMSDVLPPVDMLKLLNAYFEAMVSAVSGHGGEILKFIGDGMLAVFPVTTGIAEASRSAVEAAKDAISRLQSSDQAICATIAAADGRPTLKAGIVLHEGEVFFGNIGAPDRLDFTVIGAAVNEACRVEALTKTIGRDILLTEAVARHVQNVEHLGEHQLRGVAARVSVFGLSVDDRV